MDEFLVLIADDEAPQREMIGGFLKKQGFGVALAGGGQEALEVIRRGPVDLVLTDLRMPQMSGVELLAEVKKRNPEIPVVVMTAYGSVESAVSAMKAGAYDYLSKPIDLDDLLHLVQKVQERQHLIAENRELKERLQERYRLEGIVAESGPMQEVLSLVHRVAGSHATVLIRGESGTGKELITQAIHYHSPRAKGPFVKVNCAALPETLLESELFGHVKGAFTGAIQDKAGRFEAAHGGTIFLDEIGDISPAIQAKLLRVLQDREFERVGSNKTLQVDVRILAATNQDLEAAVRDRRFRDDLYYRLNVVPIHIPPLRERRQDIPPLINHFLQKFSKENHKRIQGFSREARDALMKYDYPGNVRELENLIERAVVLCRGEMIGVGDLPLTLRALELEREEPPSLTALLEGIERRKILEALTRSDGIQTKAAEELGISERALRYKMKKYGLPAP